MPHKCCHALSAANAQRGQAALLACALHLMEEVDGDTATGGAQGVADGDGAAVDVDLRGVPAHDLVHRHGLRGEGLVGLNEVQVARLPLRELQRLRWGASGVPPRLALLVGVHHIPSSVKPDLQCLGRFWFLDDAIPLNRRSEVILVSAPAPSRNGPKLRSEPAQMRPIPDRLGANNDRCRLLPKIDRLNVGRI